MKQDQNLHPLRDTVSTAWTSTLDSFRICPGLTTSMWLSTLILMAIPSLQVVFVTWAGSFGDRNVWLTITLATVGAVLMGTASQVSGNIQNLLQLRLRAHYNANFSTSLSRMTPAQTVDPAITTQVQAVRDAIPFNVAWQATSTVTVVGSMVSVVMLAASIWSLNPIAAILIGLAMVPELLAYSILARKENDLWRPQARVSRRAEYLEQIQDYPPSSTELAAANGTFGVPREAREKYLEYARLWSIIPKKGIQLTALSTAGVTLLTACALALILMDPSNPPSAIPAAMLGIISGLAVTRGAGSAFGELMSSTPLVIAHRQLTQLLSNNEQIARQEGPFVIEATGVSYSYDRGNAEPKVVLNNVSLTVEIGSIVALVGENGSGKTTLAKVIAGVLDPDDGQIALVDESCTRPPLTCASDRTAATSMVFQDFTRFEVTIRSFIDPSEAQSDEQLADSLKHARAWKFVSDSPEGVNTQLGNQWNGIGLSGGQWQRLAIARTFLSGAPVWILDEPTASIDANTEAQIYEDLLNARPPGTTVIVISHRPRTLRKMDNIFLIEDGAIKESGNYNDLIESGGHFACLVRSSLE